MKKFSAIHLLLLALGLQLVACNKKGDTNVFGSAVFIHASPGTPSFQVFVDSLGPINNTTVAYGSGSGYIGLIPGSRNITLENRATTPKSVYSQLAENIEAGKAYSYFLYDTLDSKGLVRTLRLNDVLTLPSSSSAAIRFLNLAPNGGNMDVTLVRGTQYDTSSTSTQKLAFAAIDSITITNQSYVGSTTPDVAALSAFKYAVTGVTGNSIAKGTTLVNIPAFNQNNRYLVKLKVAGTQTLLLSMATTLAPGRIYTVFSRGTARSQALGIFFVQHY